MSAISTEAQGNLVSDQTFINGVTNGNGQINHDIPVVVPFANQHFSHLTLYTGNTMRTGTTGQLNTNLKKSNQEVNSHYSSFLSIVNQWDMRAGVVVSLFILVQLDKGGFCLLSCVLFLWIKVLLDD